MRFIKILIPLICIILFSSCMSIIQSIYGIKNPKRLNNDQITRCSKKCGVDQQLNYRMDSTYYDFILKIDTTRFKAQRKNHIQPLQALYFDSKGAIVKYYINCYAGGFPRIKWNRNGNLNTFLPKDQAPVDTILNLERQKSFLKPVYSETPAEFKMDADYYVFIYWNKCTKRHSKHLIKSIKSNLKKAADSLKVKLIYVNYDNVLVRF